MLGAAAPAGGTPGRCNAAAPAQDPRPRWPQGGQIERSGPDLTPWRLTDSRWVYRCPARTRLGEKECAAFLFLYFFSFQYLF